MSRADILLQYSSGPKTGVFTDGSCEGNPGPGGWGAVWVEEDRIIEELGGSDPDTTNNRMELAAMIAGLRMLPPGSRATLYSDSNICVQTVNQWAAGWERRGWRRKSGPIANLELVKELWAIAQQRSGVTVQWIKAHDGSRWNEYADAIATEQTANN